MTRSHRPCATLRRIFLSAPALLLLLVGFAPASSAQGDAASISGTIVDRQGGLVVDAHVSIVNTDTGVSFDTKTNGAGVYTAPFLSPGHYRIVITKQGFKQVDLRDLTLNVQDSVNRNFTLDVGATSETIQVNGNAVNFNTTDAAVSTVVNQNFVENMPLNGRSFQDLMTLAPGAALVGNAGNANNAGPGKGGDITVNGQRTEANYFTVDGVSATVGASTNAFGQGAGIAGATPGETALGSTQTMISVDALQEFRATTSTYSAEYGRTPGGQFSFTTRSGANDWHGSAYDYFRNEALDANNWFLDELGQPKEKERQNDFGGTLGGPIIIPGLYNGKDKTFFFFSYEGLRLWTPQGVQTSSVPDTTLRNAAQPELQPLLNAFPLPNAGEDGLNDGLGLYTARVSYPSSIDSISVRVDHSFSDRFKLFGRYADTPTVASSYLTSFETNSYINNRLLTLGTTIVLTPRQTNELRFNITQNNAGGNTVSTSLGGAVPFDLTSLPGPNGKPFPVTGGALSVCLCFGSNVQGGWSQFQNGQLQYNVTDTYVWLVGRHSLKFGLDWRRLSTRAFADTIGEFIFFFSEPSVVANSVDSAEVLSFVPVEPVYTNFSAFAQDEWKLTARLSLALGLRWDVNPAPGNLTGPSPYTVDQIENLATTKLAPAGTPLWRTDWHGFAPRLGLAYQLRQTPGHETVVRSGFGIFYDMGNSAGSAGFNGIGFGSQAFFSGVSFPLTSAQLAVPPVSVTPPYNNAVLGFDPHLKLPYTLQWNFAVEQALGSTNALTVSYVGADGRRLLTTFSYSPENLGNPNFNAQVCGGCLFITKNGAASDYNALQVKFERRLAHGLQALASYTFSHSIDDASSNFYLHSLLRSSSDFDIRHNFQAALTYDIPGNYSNPAAASILSHWGLDVRISARSALPVNLIGTQTVDPVTQTYLYYNPDVVSGQPLYLYGSQYPGGKLFNFNAYQAAPAGVEGDAGRNSARGFGAWQTNLALRRDFPLHERLHLQFRAEAFNIFNHPNFGSPLNNLNFGSCGPPQPGQQPFCFGVAGDTLNNTLGGLNALYQVGGPRSLQLMLKLQF